MELFKMASGSLFNSIFYMWGVEDNPAEKRAKEIVSKSHSTKIREDLRKVNADYRKSYLRMREQSMAICE